MLHFTAKLQAILLDDDKIKIFYLGEGGRRGLVGVKRNLVVDHSFKAKFTVLS